MENKSGDDLNMAKLIDAYIKGDLSKEEEDELWVKLIRNPEYIEYLETELGVKGIIESKVEQKKTRLKAESGETGSIFTGRSMRLIAVAASIGLLLIIGYLFLNQNEVSPANLAIDSIALTDNLVTPDVVRSDTQVSFHRSDSLLRLGFEMSISGNLSDAIEKYREVIETAETQQTRATGYLNMGMVLYNKHSFGDAAESFRTVLENLENDGIIIERARWYLGNSYLKLSDLENARKTLQRVEQQDGFFGEQASRILQQLDH